MMQLHQATHIIYEKVTDVSSCIMAKKGSWDVVQWRDQIVLI